MGRRFAETALIVVLGSAACITSCGDDEESGGPAAPSGSAGDDGSASGAPGSQGGTRAVAGEANNPPGGEASQGGATSAGGLGNGASDQGGASDGGTSPGAAGEPATGGGGEGGAAPLEPPDLIIETGGPWPDSFTASCSTPTKSIPCPQSEDDFFGQDGSYRINVPTYVSSLNTVIDSVTGLMWQLRPEAVDKSQAQSVSYCDALSLAGHDDWRLPTRLEYVTLLDAGLPGGFAVPPVVPSDTTGTYWLASATGTTAGSFFVVQDELGVLTVAASGSYRARCVRGEPLSGALTVAADTVVDSMTGLEWQRASLEDTPRTWGEALAYCEDLSFATKSDWRLPSIKELVTLVDETAVSAPVIDEVSFGESDADRYWSSTPALTGSEERFAFALSTSFGATPTVKMTDAAAARCVRSAD